MHGNAGPSVAAPGFQVSHGLNRLPIPIPIAARPR